VISPKSVVDNPAQLCRGEAADLGGVQAADLRGGEGGEVLWR